MKPPLIVLLFVAYLSQLGCESTGVNRQYTTAYRTPYEEPPAGSWVDPLAAPTLSHVVPFERPLVEHGMQRVAVRDLLGTADDVIEAGRTWIYWNYRTNADLGFSQAGGALVLVFDQADRVQKMRLVDAKALRSYLAKKSAAASGRSGLAAQW